ncbi:MAG: amidohydrolase [Saprospiraceae bacterium]
MKLFYFLISLSLILSCRSEPKADVILINGNIYTVDSSLEVASAFAVKDGKFIKIGNKEDIEKLKDEHTEVIDAEGKFVMPGFIESHGHFSSLGGGLQNLDFIKSKSWDDIVAMVAEKVKTARPGQWIIGRGWHQEKWTQPLFASVHGYPMHDALSAISPNNPVMLSHASGHGVFANKKAMELAGITKETPDPKGGSIVRDAQGNAIGMFEETAQGIVRQAYNTYLKSLPPDELEKIWHHGIELAQAECLKKGVTSFEDAGSTFKEISWYKALADSGKLKLRLWVMIGEPSKNMSAGELDSYPWKGIGNDHFSVGGIKTYVDGALGSYGAWLLSPYADRDDKFYGQNTTDISEINAVAELCIKHGLQLCVHAIGDRANREVLNIMENQFKTHPGKTDLRWRIEHAQHIDTSDIPRFAKMGVIAAMQGIHCTSDAPFVEKRLGPFRAKYESYPWRSLLDAGAVVTNGTDVPVENVDPIESFYASVTRKRADNGFSFFPEQAMTRAEAARSYTLSGAYAAFQEDSRGSISTNKWADFIVLSQDLIHCADEDILKTKVEKTFVGGKLAN